MARPAFGTAAQVSTDDRSTFITKTYLHLIVAVFAFVGLESVLLKSEMGQRLGYTMLNNWWLLWGGFMLVSWLATRFAHNVKSRAMQYFGLGLIVTAYAVIFLPMMMYAQQMANGGGSLIFRAGMITLSGFFALTAIAFITRKNFSFLRSFLMWGGVIAFILIVCSGLFGLSLGIWFSVGMVGFAGAAILYDTSNIIHEYNDEQYVGAAVQLFASLALMFWYVLQLVLSFSGDD